MKKNISDTYRQNIAVVMEYLYRTTQTSRIEISRNTGLTPAAITSIISDLVTKKIVLETGNEINGSKGSGRKQKIIQLNKDVGYLIGIEINMTGIFAVITDIIGTILNQVSVPNSSYDSLKINEVVTTLIRKVTNKFPKEKIFGIGIAVPGHLNDENQTIVSNNLMWQHFNLSKIKKEFPYAMNAENNIKCMALREYLFNPAQTPDKFLFFHIGPGMFCSFFQANQIGIDENFYIGEIGHTIVDIHGPQCECGKKGCLQTYISSSWLLKNARFLFEHSTNTVLQSLVQSADQITLQTICDGYTLGDTYLSSKLDLGLKMLATSISNTLILQDAKKIYLNSELLSHNNFSNQIISSIKEQLSFIPTCRDTDIEIIPFDHFRGAQGAAALSAISFVIRHKGYIV
ncbi:XylR family transcriptional regulator [Enterococcus casseliflavus]|nr:XylR family transcriptional regulator [Enterococcus casseliflavus]